ncbi:MAG TPA: NADH-quinone oxidoreductase subunit N [Actinomycetota bacterium]|nr:NADH-quinone oxidoreductase subunit N [Actinomycetota bacterium]
MNQSIDYHAILPETILSATILLVLIADAFLSARRKWFTMPIGFVGTAAALVATLTLIGENRTTFDGMFVVDGFAVLFKTFFLAVALLVLLISLRYFRDGRFYQGEYYFLLLTSFLGCLLMPSSRDLLMLFISLELVSAPGFLIAAFRKSDPRSNEAGLKFFLIGVLSTAVMLYGMSLIYGVTGSLNLGEIATALSGPLPRGQETLVLAAILFVVAGFAFKVSAVPFQFWAPDTYEGAPVPVAAFLATASKAAGFAGLLQLMFVAFVNQHEFWTPIFAALSIATMTIGNLVALQQQQVVRLLAYSSIAQAGYMLLPFALVSSDMGVNQDAFAAAVTYILIYAIMTLGAFAVVIAMSRESRGLLISDFAGLGRRAGLLAFAMTVFMVSLAGIPPTAGFWAKFVVFGAAIERGGIGTVLAVIMIVNSVISLYYYLAVPRQMLFVEPEQDRPLMSPALVTAVTVITTVAVVAIGVWPELIARFPPLSTLVER